MLDVPFTHFNSEFFVHRYLPETNIISKYPKPFPLGELTKILQSTSSPTRGRTIRSGISVPLLTVLYACPVFRTDLVLFIFHFDSTIVYLFLFFSLLFSFSVVISVFCGSFSAETLISSNEELLLSEVSE